MLIDWFTVVAQIVNFLVLVALMKHFLYGRLLRAIDEREAGIAARLAEVGPEEPDGRSADAQDSEPVPGSSNSFVFIPSRRYRRKPRKNINS